MPGYNLTPAQKDLLRQLVAAARREQLPESFIVNFRRGKGYWIRLSDGKILWCRSRDDMEALRELGLVGGQPNSQGETAYSLRQSAFDAVDTDFAPRPEPAPTQNIGAVIGVVHGGPVQAVGYADRSSVSQIQEDPSQFADALDTCIEKIVELVKPELDAREMAEYAKELHKVKAELLSDKPNESTLKRALSSLAFLAAIQGSVALMERVWPAIQPLLTLAAARLGQ